MINSTHSVQENSLTLLLRATGHTPLSKVKYHKPKTVGARD